MPTRRGDAEAGQGEQLVRVLITETREELLKADSKAGLMLTALGVALTALLGAISGGGITPRGYPMVPQALFWAGCVAWVPSLVMLGLAVAPRAGKPRRLRAHYYGTRRKRPRSASWRPRYGGPTPWTAT